MKLTAIATYAGIGSKLRRGTAAMAVLALAAPLTAYALPKGGTVIEGSAKIIQLSPNKLEVLQKSANTEIEWQSFDIGKGQTVIFIQGGAKNKALNEIEGGQTVIDGKLIADGTLILINAHGILFGADARAEVARLIASTANVSFADVAAGRFNFSIPGAAGATISNAGDITARQGGLVAFIAPNVVNSGIINARLGKVALAAGDAATLDLYGDGLISIVLGGNSPSAILRQSGKIFAAGGTVQLTASQAKSLVESVVNLDGVVRADSVAERDGTIELAASNVNVSGEVAADGIAPGTAGGSVKLLGGNIHLTSTANVTASGQTGGGQVLVGGNDQGKGPEPDAATVVADAGSQIHADATRRGKGGRVVLWSNDRTIAHGTISTVGAGGGKGGFIETSSAGQLVVDGTVNSGRGGQWLLDPYNITIEDATQDQTISQSACAGVCLVAPTGNDSILSTKTLDADLANNSDVTVMTTGAGSQAGNITVASAIQKTAGGDSFLALQADGSIFINAAISSTKGKLGLDLLSTLNNPNPGKATLNANLSLNGGQFDSTLPVIVQQSTIDSGGGNINFHNTVDGPGNLTLKAGTGDITFTGIVGGGSTLGALDIQSAQTADFQAAVLTQQFTQEAGTQLHFQDRLSVFGANNSDAVNITADDILLDPGSVLSANGNVTINLGGTSALTLSAGTNGNNPAKIEVANGSFTQTGDGSVFLGGPVSTKGGAIIFNGFVLVTNPNGISVCSTGPACDTSYSTGDITFSNTLDTDSQVTAHYDLTISAAQFANLNQVGTSNPINNLTISADTITGSQVDAAGSLVMSAAGVNTPNTLAAAITGNYSAASIVVGARDSTADLPPMKFFGTISGKQPTGQTDTGHLPSLAMNTVVGTGPYTFDNVCFAACSNNGGGGGNNGGGGGNNGGGNPGTSVAGLTGAEASVLLELETALTTTQQVELASILPTLPNDEVVAVLDQLEAATPEQRAALVDLLKTANITQLAQDDSVTSLVGNLAKLVSASDSISIGNASLILANAGQPITPHQYDGGTLVNAPSSLITGPTFAAQAAPPAQSGTTAPTQNSGDQVHTYSLESLNGPAGNGATAAQIADAYHQVFGRDPTSADMAAWQRVAANGWTETQIIASLKGELGGTGGNATTNTANVITAAFQKILGRSPTAPELSQFEQQQNPNAPLDYNDFADMVTTLVESPAKGAETRADMIVRSYETNLGRAPTQDELNYWNNQLQTGNATFQSMMTDNANWYETQPTEQAKDIAQAVQAIFGTSEANVGWSTIYAELVKNYGTPTNYQQLYNDLEKMMQPGGQKLAITNAYLAVYGRQPYPYELTALLGTKDGGGQLTNYADVVATLTAQRTQQILDVYSTELGRTPTPAELSTATNVLAHNGSLGAVAAYVAPNFASPDEAAMVIRAYVQAYNRYPTQQELNSLETSANLTKYNSYGSLLQHLQSTTDPLAGQRAQNKLQPVGPYPEGALTLPGGFTVTPQWDGTFQVTAKANATGTLNLSLGGQAYTFQNTNGTLRATNDGNIQTSAASQIASLTLSNGEKVALYGQAGSGVISNDGGSVVSNDGGSIVGGCGGCVVSNDGGSIVSNDGGSVVSNASSTVVSNDGGSLRASVAIISQDGSGIISQDGSGIISQDGSGIISQDGSGIISQDGSGIITHDGASVVSNDGGSFTVAASIISQDGSGIISQDGSGIISQDGSGLISEDGIGLVSEKGNGLLTEGGSGLLTDNGAALVSENGNGIIGYNMPGLITDNGAALISNGSGGLVPQFGALVAN